MRLPLILSVVFHVTIVLVAWLGLPHVMPDPLRDVEPIFVEVVDIAETRNAPPPSREEPKKEEPKPEPPKPAEAKPAPPKPQPPQPEPPQVAAVPPKPEAEPAPKERKPEPEPEKKETKPEPPKPAKPQPRLTQVQVPKKPKQKKPEFDTASVLKTLEKIKQQPKTEAKDEKKKEKPQEKVEDDTMAKIRAALSKSPEIKYDPTKAVSATEIDVWRAMIRKKVSECWNPPVGARDAQNLKPELRLTLSPDGTVQDVRVVDTARMFTDRQFQVAAEAALRAVKNPRCNKFELPADKYQVWKDMKFIFDPSEML